MSHIEKINIISFLSKNKWWPFVFYVVFCGSFFVLCPFSCGHCIVCPSIYGFRLPLWYLQALLITVSSLIGCLWNNIIFASCRQKKVLSKIWSQVYSNVTLNFSTVEFNIWLVTKNKHYRKSLTTYLFLNVDTILG